MAAERGRPAGAVLLAAGVALMWLAWRWRAGGGLAVVQAAIAGPLSATLGLGMLIHGEGMPRDGMSRLTRAYGLAGGLAGGAYLFLIGRLADWPTWGMRWLIVLAVIGIWLIPVPAAGRADREPDDS